MKKSTQPSVLPSTALCNVHVRSAKGDDLGRVEDLMIDLHSGRVVYAVLSFGGFLKMGTKLFAIPWEALTLDTVKKEFTLHVERSRLEKAPGFDKDNWPDMADPEFGATLYRHFGFKPHWEETA